MSVKELTIEHLAAYLPYGLTWYHKRMDSEPTSLLTMIAVQFDNSAEHGYDVQFEDEWLNDLIGIYVEGFPTWKKPILRPISDLTNEITHNGETFVPNERMLSDLSVDRESILYLMKMFEVGIGYQVEWQIIQKLHSWHFDTFGLIEAGLAIDINTINK